MELINNYKIQKETHLINYEYIDTKGNAELTKGIKAKYIFLHNDKYWDYLDNKLNWHLMRKTEELTKNLEIFCICKNKNNSFDCFDKHGTVYTYSDKIILKK